MRAFIFSAVACKKPNKKKVVTVVEISMIKNSSRVRNKKKINGLQDSDETSSALRRLQWGESVISLLP